MDNFLKDYEPVEDRLRLFHKDYPDGRVITTLISHADGDYIVYAEVWRTPSELPAASGLAHDSSDRLPPHLANSALEIAETSAIGRALANMGYAAKGKRPSREEMSKSSPAKSPATGGTTVTPRATETAGDSSSPAAGPAASATAGVASGTSTSGAEADGVVETTVLDPAPDLTSPPAIGDRNTAAETPAEGEAAGTGTGGGSQTSPGVTKKKTYPIDPAQCTHKFPSGSWLKWDADERCPKCGTPKVSAVEGTTADLGSA